MLCGLFGSDCMADDRDKVSDQYPITAVTQHDLQAATTRYASLSSGEIPSGKLTASLRKMPIPTRIMLVLIVMLRFAPTVLHEFGEVREAMKIRGFLKSVGNVLRHPMDTLEYAIVPMVFRSLKIADELAASAIVRGIESPYKKESYYVSRIAALDYFLIVVSVGAAVCCCLL